MKLTATVLARALTAANPPPTPGPAWHHDHGPVYWACTNDGQELLKDNATGVATVTPDDQRRDQGE